MYFITIPECEARLKARINADDQIIVLKPNKPLLPQLSIIPEGADIIASPPAEWSDTDKNRFAYKVEECLLSIQVTRNTVKAFEKDWEENAFWNYDVCISAPPVDKLQKTGDYALVAGSGPSVKEGHNWRAPGEPHIFAAWSSQAATVADVIAHCDHREQRHIDANPRQGIVLTPTAAREFAQHFPDTVAYVYFDRGNRLNWRFAEKRNLPDHEPIIANVVDMLIQCAIYAGHTNIKLIGVDLCCKTPEEVFKYHPFTAVVHEATNYRGETVYTDEIFQLYQKGIESLVVRHPEIQFSVVSDQGVIIEGVPFEEL